MSPRTYPPAPGWSHRTLTASQGAPGIRSCSREGMGLRRALCGYGTGKLSHVHWPLSRNTQRRLPATTTQGRRAGESERRPLPHNGQPLQPRKPTYPGMVGEAPAGRAGLYPGRRVLALNLQEGWWRPFRRETLAGQTFANGEEIERAARVATLQLNRRAKPWVWGREQEPPRHRWRSLVYRL